MGRGAQCVMCTANDGNLADFASLTGLILLNSGGGHNITTLIEY